MATGSIYVNSQIQDKTELGELIHYFYYTNPKDMYNKKLANEVEYYKGKKRGEMEKFNLTKEDAIAKVYEIWGN